MAEKTLSEIYDALTAPLATHEIEVKAGSKLMTGEDGGKALAIPYLNATAIRRRLNQVAGPENWSERYEVWNVDEPALAVDPETGEMKPGRGRRIAVWCGLTICGVTHTDVGEAFSEEEAFKAAVTDSFKRAAVCFGVGWQLYYLAPIWWPASASGKYVRFTREGELLVSIVEKVANLTAELTGKGKPTLEATEEEPTPAKPQGIREQQMDEARKRFRLAAIARFGAEGAGGNDGTAWLRKQGVEDAKALTVASLRDLTEKLSIEVQEAHAGAQAYEDAQEVAG